LPSQLGEATICTLIRVLFHSESNLTLCEKFIANHSIGHDPFFWQPYEHINPEFSYGHASYLRARKVKNLRAEESKNDCLESTLYWTELPKFIRNPEIDTNAPLADGLAKLVKEIQGEKDASYTYSIGPSSDESKRRRAAFQAD
jgi:hypothetical protein